jgi:septum formation protein
MAVDTPEDLTSELAATPELLAAHLAAEKAQAASDERLLGLEDVVVAFDTIVVLDGAVLGKPRDVADAWRMLHSLSGRTHEVVTGVSLLARDMKTPQEFAVTTSVRMKPLSDCQIEAWMALGEFMGCAGAYNIEGQVAEVDTDECYQNVAGLPLCHLRRALAQTNLPCALSALSSPAEACDSALGRRCRLAPLLSPSAL